MPHARPSRADGGCPFAYTPSQLAGPVCWQPELVATTIVLVPGPDGFDRARTVDPAALGPLLGAPRTFGATVRASY